jgi:hypothetical protein
MPGNADLSRINALPPLDSGGCAQIMWRHGDLLATAREARLAGDARQRAQAESNRPAEPASRPLRLSWRFPFLRAAR